MWEPEDGTDSMKEPDFLGGQCSGMEGAGLTYFGDFFFSRPSFLDASQLLCLFF